MGVIKHERVQASSPWHVPSCKCQGYVTVHARTFIEMDKNDDGKVILEEFIAACLGEKKFSEMLTVKLRCVCWIVKDLLNKHIGLKWWIIDSFHMLPW